MYILETKHNNSGNQKIFGSATLTQVGHCIFGGIIEKAIGNDENLSPRKLLDTINEAYYFSHKGVLNERRSVILGSYSWKVDEEGNLIFTADTPYPLSFDRGIITAILQKLSERFDIKLGLHVYKENIFTTSGRILTAIIKPEHTLDTNDQERRKKLIKALT